jgi:hypothetical protein
VVGLIVVVAGMALVLIVVTTWVVQGLWRVGRRNEEMVAGGSHGRQTRRVKEERPE